MAKTPKYILGGRGFFTIQEAVNRAKEIKNAHIEDSFITNDEDIAFLADLVSHHPRIAEKIGSGIRAFAAFPNLNGYELRIVHTGDEPPTNFSLKKCLAKYNQNNALFEACRISVRTQIVDFKKNTFENSNAVECPVTRDQITPDICNVHHKPPNTFNILVLRWMAQNGLTLESVKLGGTGPDDAQKYLADDPQEQSWQAFHQENADLKILSIPGHYAEHAAKNKADG